MDIRHSYGSGSSGISDIKILNDRTTKEKNQMPTFTAIIYKEDNLYVAQCPEVGTASQGETIEASLGNLREATELYLEEFPVQKTCKPMMTTFETATHA